MPERAPNPYETPQREPSPFLSRSERTVLELYAKFRYSPLTMSWLVASYYRIWLLAIGLFAIISFAVLGLIVLIGPHVALLAFFGFSAGMVFGAFLRDISYIRRVLITMPILVQVIDWQRLDRFLYQGAPDQPDSTSATR